MTIDDDGIIDDLKKSVAAYHDLDYTAASQSLNDAWVKLYESTALSRDLHPQTAYFVIETIENRFPSITHGEKWWIRSYQDSIRSVNTLAREWLDSLS